MAARVAWARMIRRLYDWVLRLAAHPRAELWLAVIAFAESSFFPIPPDAMLLPMCLARPERAYRYALICTVASVVGGVVGYGIGWGLYETVAAPVIRFYHYEAQYEAFKALFDQYGLWVILIKGLTPIPYKIVTIASGAVHFDFAVFLLASIATRGARFYLVALLLRQFGPPIRTFVEQRLTLVTTVAALALVGGFVALKFL
jgi:membrane protein YqaA with SNARE-associated domain